MNAIRKYIAGIAALGIVAGASLPAVANMPNRPLAQFNNYFAPTPQ